MADFRRAVDWVIAHEIRDDTGWTRDPGDPGGATRWGISSRAHPDVDLERLQRIDAKALYRERYWLKIRGDALPEALGLPLLDYSVLQGAPTAIRALQGILGVEPDGKLGRVTLAAIDARPPRPLAREIVAVRKRQLLAGPERYRVGWLSRLVDLALEL